MIRAFHRWLVGAGRATLTLSTTTVATAGMHVPGPVGAQAISLTLRTDYRIRVGRDAPEGGLASIRWITWSSSGAMLVYDGRRGRLVHFDSGGRRTAHGRLPAMVASGDASPAGAAFLGDSAFVLWEPVVSRLTFGTIGDSATREVRVPHRGYVAGVGNFVFAWRDGTIGLRVISGPPPGLDYWLRYSREGALLDSIPVPDRQPLRSSDDGPRAPFARSQVSVPLFSGGVAIGDPERFEIRRRAVNDVIAFQRPYVRVAVAPGEAAMWRRMLSGGSTMSGGPEIPTSKPAFRRLLSDPSGRIWIDRYTAAEEVDQRGVAADGFSRWSWREPTVLEAIDEITGEIVATLAVPAGHAVLYIQGGRLWALVTDSGGTWLTGMTLQR